VQPISNSNETEFLYEALMIADQSDAAGTVQIRSPYDQQVIANVETANAVHVEKALQIAHKLFRNRDAWISLHERIEILERAADLMKQNHESLTLLAAREGGKPLRDSQVEVTRAIDGIKLCIETLGSDTGRVVPMGNTLASAGRLVFTQKEPIGVAAVSAFNHPLNLIVHQVGAAVAAGCPVIVKPADDTP
jgi:acyl-CoA reductase-like NAD-dependent aldehyde dehydrogenase